jgi:hypothetical protein
MSPAPTRTTLVGVGVGVGVGPGVGVGVAVGVGVGVGVGPGLGVGAGVGLGLGVALGVRVGLGLWLGRFGFAAGTGPSTEAASAITGRTPIATTTAMRMSARQLTDRIECLPQWTERPMLVSPARDSAEHQGISAACQRTQRYGHPSRNLMDFSSRIGVMAEHGAPDGAHDTA